MRRLVWLLALIGCTSENNANLEAPPGFDVPVGSEGLTSAEVFASNAWLSVCRGDYLGQSLLTIQVIDSTQGFADAAAHAEWARRCRQATGQPWPLDRAVAEKDDGCDDR